MADRFRVALSGAFRRPTERRPIPTSTSRHSAPRRVEPAFTNWRTRVAATSRAIPTRSFCSPTVSAVERGGSDWLGVVARFGVGDDKVDVDACTEAAIALLITPDGVLRPVAGSFVDAAARADREADREGSPHPVAAGGVSPGEPTIWGSASSAAHCLVGIGNIGAEMFRLARPFDMKFVAHDPFADKGMAAELGIELVSLEDAFRRADVLSVSVPRRRRPATSSMPSASP